MQEVMQKKKLFLTPATPCSRRQVSEEPEKAWPAVPENGAEMTVTDHIVKNTGEMGNTPCMTECELAQFNCESVLRSCTQLRLALPDLTLFAMAMSKIAWT